MRCKFHHAAAAAFLLSCSLGGQERTVYDTGTVIRVYGNKMEVGEVVGVQYTEDGRYVIWATPPKGHTDSNIWRDEVIQVARLALEVREDPRNAVSFDFVRKASSPFRSDDILDPVGFGRILDSNRDLAELLRRLPDGSKLGATLALQSGKRPDKRVLKRAAALLNRARECDLNIAANADFLSPAARVALNAGKKEKSQLNRIILEDFFSPTLDRDVGNRYVTEYASAKAELLLKGSRTEAVFMDGDTDLKHISAGRAGGEFAIGRSEIMLCGEQARADLQRGGDPHRGEYSTFLHLEGPDYEPIKGDGTGAWMRNATLTVQAHPVTGETPECANRYAANVTRKIPFILRQDAEIPQHLRDLKTMLLLHRAVQFLMKNSVPLSPERLGQLALDTERLPNTPPRVVQTPLVIASNDRAMLFSISGGLQFGGDSLFANPALTGAPGTGDIRARQCRVYRDDRQYRRTATMGDRCLFDLGAVNRLVRMKWRS